MNPCFQDPKSDYTPKWSVSSEDEEDNDYGRHVRPPLPVTDVSLQLARLQAAAAPVYLLAKFEGLGREDPVREAFRLLSKVSSGTDRSTYINGQALTILILLLLGPHAEADDEGLPEQAGRDRGYPQTLFGKDAGPVQLTGKESGEC